MSEKILPRHRERAGYVYVRQSTMYQVRENVEGRRRQYALVEQARELGFRTVEVIDDDLGRSGSGLQERHGFSRLLTAVCEGTVGAVLAAEASRLARNNRDWHHLIDLCALTGTLVIDHDGVYDPRLLNDRLLLGLKGTMSEFELGLMRQRAQEALRRMIERGEVLTEVAVGYVRTEDNRCEMTPDLQVQQAIRGVFAKFRELGSARQVLLWHRQEGMPLPTPGFRDGRREVVWRPAIYHRVLSILKNPTYAGAFAYGQRRTRTVVRGGRARKTSGHRVPREEWQVLLRDHHPGYIGWDEYLRNQDLLEANAGMKGRVKQGAAKEGRALLAGLLRCARCGRRFRVAYSGRRGEAHRYECKGRHLNLGGPRCVSFGGLRVDRAMAGEVLKALQPVAIEASLAAWEQATVQEDQKQQALLLAVEKARYEAERARRQYDEVDPEYRLVAADLERRWNEALEHLAEKEAQLAAMPGPGAVVVAEEERERLLDLGADLDRLWSHPKASASLKKRILRTAVKEIVADVSEQPPEVSLRIHWAGGVHTELRVAKNPTGRHSRCTDRKVVDLIRELAEMCDDCRIAWVLNRLGYTTGAGNTWTEPRVRSLRSYQKIPAFDAEVGRSWLTLAESAATLGVSPCFVRRLLKEGALLGRQVVSWAPWRIERADLEGPQVRAAVRALREGRKMPRRVPDQDLLPLLSSR